MAETIESFVARLQAEGVEVGQAEAEKLRAEARRQAEQLVSGAKAEAARIVAEAERQAAQTAARARTEVELAARDTMASLRQSLNRALEAVLARGVQSQLSDANFLREVIRELVMLYGKADLDGQAMTITVAPLMRDKLVDWVLKELHGGLVGSGKVDLHGTLAEDGFEYAVNGGTVEVTGSSVVQALSRLVGPELRKVIEQAETR